MLGSVIRGLGYECEILEQASSDKDESTLEVIITSRKFDIPTMDEIVGIHRHFDKALTKDDESLEMDYNLGVENGVIRLKMVVFIPNNPWGAQLFQYRVAKSILYDKYESTTMGANIVFYNNGSGFIDASSFMLEIKTSTECKLRNESEYGNKIVLYQPNPNKFYGFSYKGDFGIERYRWVNSSGANEEVSYL